MPGLGSNSWVIAPARSASGGALLANDPHLQLSNPGVWYLARLEAPGLAVIGATLPGVPAVILGRNEQIAWGLTNLPADTQDTYLERVDPTDPSRYLDPVEGALPFRVREETIAVAGAAPVHVRVRETKRGPVIRDDLDGRGPVTLRWVALDPDDTTVEGILAVATAHDWQEFQSALSRFISPAQNFVYADRAGHIGYRAVGRIPLRARGDGSLPLPAWEPGNEWLGSVPFERMPRVLDPPDGFIVTANQRVGGDVFFTRDWEEPYRAMRIRELIRERAKHSLDDVIRMQRDVTSLLARALAPKLASALDANDPRDREVAALLAAWDGRAAPESAAAAIFVAWYGRMQRALACDELGPELCARLPEAPRFVEWALGEPGEAWCDDVTTPARERCGELVRRELRAALDELSQRQGSKRPASWRLDHLLRVRFDNPVGGRVPVLGGLFKRSVGLGGDGYTVRVAGFKAGSYDVQGGVSCIADHDLGINETRLALPLGQSGHPLSRHYDDMLARWLNGDPRPVTPLGELVHGDELLLEPERD